MPDYRKLHNGHGNSEKLTMLTDFEFRVWNQYRASADDFGVCPLSPTKLQGDNRRLEKVPAAKVLAALKRTIDVGLTLSFVHQNQTFICTPNWQDYEDIRYPRHTLYPVPPPEVFDLLSVKTAELFRNSSRKDSEEFPHLARARARETQTLTQTKPITLTLIDPKTRSEGEGAGEGVELVDVVPAPNTWTHIVDALRPEIGHRSIATWFEPCRLMAEYPDAIRVAVPTALFIEWIHKHYSVILGDVCKRLIPKKAVRLELAPAEMRRAS